MMAYLMILMIAVGNTLAVMILNKKRQGLDLSKPEDAQQDKRYKLVATMLIIDTPLLALLIYFFVKPMLDGAGN